jgi:Sulfate permease family
VTVTGEVPTGLFSIGLPGIGWSQVDTALLAGAFSVIFVGYSESLASARMMSLKYGQPIDPDQELIAQGAACGAAGLVGGFANDAACPRPGSPTPPGRSRRWPRSSTPRSFCPGVISVDRLPAHRALGPGVAEEPISRSMASSQMMGRADP